LVGSGGGPSFGLWYDFRQKLPLGDYAAFYAECLEEIEEEERLGFTGASWLSGHHFVDDGYLPWERYLVGTPEEVADGLIGLYGEAPYDHFCFWGRLPGVTHEETLENMRLFSTEVAPRVRKAVGTANA
jgi:hypothetical protein